RILGNVKVDERRPDATLVREVVLEALTRAVTEGLPRHGPARRQGLDAEILRSPHRVALARPRLGDRGSDAVSLSARAGPGDRGAPAWRTRRIAAHADYRDDAVAGPGVTRLAR